MQFIEWVDRALAIGCQLSVALEYWNDWCLVFCGRWRDVHMEGLSGKPLQEMTIVQAIVATFSDDQDSLSAAVSKWLRLREFDNELNNAGMYGAAAIHEMSRGDLKQAEAQLKRSWFAVERTRSVYGRCWVLLLQSLNLILRGRANEAERTLLKAKSLCEHKLINNLAMLRVVRQMSALVMWLKGFDEEARQEFLSIPVSETEYGLPIMMMMVSKAMQDLQIEQHLVLQEGWIQSEDAYAIIEIDQIELAQSQGHTAVEISRNIASLEDRLHFSAEQGRTLKTAHWSLRERYELISARSLIVTGNFEEALKGLAPVIQRCQRDGNELILIHAELLKTAALWSSKKTERPKGC